MLHFSAPPPLALYIHLPWCVHKCPYCDFNSHPLRRELPADDYVAALLRDLELEAPAAHRRPVESIFFGGGTPSLFPPDAVARLLKGVAQRIPLAEDAEITLEANPGTVEQAKFEGYRNAGVNRLSIGIQSFHPERLRALGRIHGRDEALAAADAARRAGFDNFNLDLMFGLPAQDLAGALADVDQAIALRPTHISHYQLTLEPNTVFYARPPVLPADDDIYEMQLTCQARLAEAGYQQYEVSAYAQADRRCRHNLNYWQFGDYIGIGAGAHGKLTDVATGTIWRNSKRKNPRDYLQHAGKPTQVASETRLAKADILLEFLMNALRLSEGFEKSLCTVRTGLPWSTFEATLAELVAEGLLEENAERVKTTPKGALFLDEILQRFLPDED